MKNWEKTTSIDQIHEEITRMIKYLPPICIVIQTEDDTVLSMSDSMEQVPLKERQSMAIPMINIITEAFGNEEG